MTEYKAPPGWVETYLVYQGMRRLDVFHLERDCPRVKHSGDLRPVERPGPATRCRLCAGPT